MQNGITRRSFMDRAVKAVGLAIAAIIGLPALGRLVSPAWYEVGRFLGPNIEQFHAGEPDLPALWRAAGIVDVRQEAAASAAQGSRAQRYPGLGPAMLGRIG